VLTIADASIVEGDAGNKPLSFTVSLSKLSNADVSFVASTDTGTAIAETDFVPLAPTVFTIPHGQLSLTINVPVVGDTDAEANESFVVEIGSPVGATIATSRAAARIVNDDRPVLDIEDASVDEGAPGERRTVHVLVHLSAPLSTAVGFRLRTRGNLSATTGVDFDDHDILVAVMDAGRTTKLFDVQVIGDDVVEGPETFQVVAETLGDGSFTPGRNGTVTILDDDGAATVAASSRAKGAALRTARRTRAGRD
jgi:hypothetical protein